jgi:hypothetical protein
MSNTDISKLALKIFSLYVIVQVLLAIPQFFQAYVMLSNGSEYNSAKWFMLISALAIILLFLLSVAIWKLSNNTKSILSKNTDNSLSQISEEFVLSLLGVYLIVYGLTRITVVATSAYYSANATNDTNYQITQSIIYVVVYLLAAILGLSLIIKSKGWVSMLNKLRIAGT